MRLTLPNREGTWITAKAQRVRCAACKRQEMVHFICRPENDGWMVGMNCPCGVEEWRLCTDEEVMKFGEALEGWNTAEDFANDVDY